MTHSRPHQPRIAYNFNGCTCPWCSVTPNVDTMALGQCHDVFSYKTDEPSGCLGVADDIDAHDHMHENDKTPEGRT